MTIIGSSPISMGTLDGKPLRGNVNRFPLPAPAPIAETYFERQVYTGVNSYSTCLNTPCSAAGSSPTVVAIKVPPISCVSCSMSEGVLEGVSLELLTPIT